MPNTLGPRCTTTTTTTITYSRPLRLLRLHLRRFGRPIAIHHTQACTDFPTLTWRQCITVQQAPTHTCTITTCMLMAPVLMLVGQATCCIKFKRWHRGLALLLTAPGSMPAQAPKGTGKSPPRSGSTDWNTCVSTTSSEERVVRHSGQAQNATGEARRGVERRRSAMSYRNFNILATLTQWFWSFWRR